jgi:hypothetical protein
MRTEFKKSNNSLIEWDLNVKPHENYFIREKLLIDICYVIQSYYNEKEKSFSFSRLVVTPVKDKKDRWKVSITQDFAESDSEDMQDIIEIFRTVLINALTKPNFNKLKAGKKNTENENTLFVEGINKIIQNVEMEIPLKGEYDFENPTK